MAGIWDTEQRKNPDSWAQCSVILNHLYPGEKMVDAGSYGRKTFGEQIGSHAAQDLLSIFPWSALHDMTKIVKPTHLIVWVHVDQNSFLD